MWRLMDLEMFTKDDFRALKFEKKEVLG